MKYSRNKVSGVMECYTDEGVFVGIIAAQGSSMENRKAEDGGPGSGNWGHLGRPGKRGGSGKGGGKAYRTGSKEEGYRQNTEVLHQVKGPERQEKSKGKKIETTFKNSKNGGRWGSSTMKHQAENYAEAQKQAVEAYKSKDVEGLSDAVGRLANAASWSDAWKSDHALKNSEKMYGIRDLPEEWTERLSAEEDATLKGLVEKYNELDLRDTLPPEEDELMVALQAKLLGAEIEPEISDDLLSKYAGIEQREEVPGQFSMFFGENVPAEEPPKKKSVRDLVSDKTREELEKKLGYSMKVEGKDFDEALLERINDPKVNRYSKDDVLDLIGKDLGWEDKANKREFENLNDQEKKDMNYLMDRFPWNDDPKYAKYFNESNLRDGTEKSIYDYFAALKAKELGIDGVEVPQKPALLDHLMNDPRAENPLIDVEPKEHTVSEAGNKHRESISSFLKSPDADSRIFNGSTREDRLAIIKSVENMDDGAAELVAKTLPNLNVNWSAESTCYTRGSGTISIAGSLSRSAETFWHEYGHYIDDAYFSKSGMSAVVYSMTSDGRDISGTTNLANVKNELCKASQSDVDALLKRLKLDDRYKTKPSYSGDTFNITRDGENILPSTSFSGCNELEEAFTNAIHEWSGKNEADQLLKNAGEPQRPEWSDYYTTYTTPKRNITRTKEKYKGAEKAYMDAYQEYRDDHDKWVADMGNEKYDALLKKQHEMWKKADEREQKAGAITDSLDESVGGAFLAVILHGGHDYNYYATHGRVETTANMFQIMATGDKDQIDCVKTFLPNTYKHMMKTWRYRPR